jgi:AP-2 complex subunit alpha
VYIHVLGYEVDFGHAEVLVLVRSPKYSESMWIHRSCLLMQGDDPMMVAIRSHIIKDLTVPTPAGGKNAPSDAGQALALCAIANITGLELYNR